ncbi:hypothetical protein F0562_030458 [Nyssa sinensis]|uniref:BHLH domain-containing protein n=1 Tax=Nyssa sinensis TaxID=561372 RepID=A0A5J5AWG0_9ASTE|nr:hypothetical protein F0562_030458 [Nyssa sinensis]
MIISPTGTPVSKKCKTSFSHNHQHQEQHLQHIEIQNGHNQIFNSSSMPDTPYPPTPDILNLFHVSRCSSSSFLPNSSFSIPNQTQKSVNLATSLGFLGSVSNVFYDPLLHLNLPPQPTLFRELHDPLPHGFNLPGTRAGNLFAGVDEREASGVYQDGDGSHFANGVLEISRDIKLAQKRDGKKTKSFTTERHMREHFNEKFKVLRSLVPNPTKGRSAFHDHFGFYQSSLSGNQLQQNQWFGGKRRG